jgi:hypothetical protein
MSKYCHFFYLRIFELQLLFVVSRMQRAGTTALRFVFFVSEHISSITLERLRRHTATI